MKNLTINDLSKIRKIINLTINVLENNINNFSNHDEDKKFIDFLIGNRESVVSVISKLTNLLVKVIIPLEDKMNSENSKTEERLEEDDMEILKKYIERCIVSQGRNNNI